MKQIISLFFICLFVLLHSCTKKEIKEPKVEYKKPQVLLITDASGIGDQAFNAAAFSGLLSYYGDTIERQTYRGSYYDVIESSSNDEALTLLEEAVHGKKYNLIISPGDSLSPVLVSMAKKHPEQKFMFVDTMQNLLPNVISFTFPEEQGAFLVGAAAAFQAQFEGRENPSFGFIGGEKSSVITKFQLGFIQGINYVYPDAHIEEYYTGSWNRKDLAYHKSSLWYENGIYAVFTAAGASSLGTIEAAKRYRQKGYNVWALGVDADQHSLGVYAPNKSAVLTSMLKDVGRAVIYTLNMIEAGDFVQGSIVFDLAAEGVSYTKTNSDLLPQVAVSLDKLKKSMLEGKIYIYSNYKEAQKAGVVQELQYAVH